jgi:hypothetical protein
VTIFEIVASGAVVVMAALVVVLFLRDRAKRANEDLIQLWQVAFEASPIAMLVRQNGVYVECNDATVSILGAKGKAHVLETGPAKIIVERQPDGRLATDIMRECSEALKVGKAYHSRGIECRSLDTNKTLYIDAYWVLAKYRGDDATITYVVDASDRVRIVEEARAHVRQLAQNFEKSIGGLVESLASTASQMRSTSNDMSVIAKDTATQANSVSTAVEEASSSVEIVAAATEELSSSVSEIGRQVTQSAEISSQAVDEANRTNTTVLSLTEAAQKIGDVIELISAIASQTNLLALNATIEAARAGESGKGFAVVANEVKSLASQTGKATDEITAQVAAMQAATRDVVEAIKNIGGTIGAMNQIATTIAAAVEEQGSATREIARNVNATASGTQQISVSITGVTRSAGEAGDAAGRVLTVADELRMQAETLRSNVNGFLGSIRAA